MRVLVLSKRQYMGKDLLDDAYGRFHELPLELARLGHEVHGLCASYRPRREGEFHVSRDGASVTWQARNVQPYSPLSIARWAASAAAATRRLRPDVVWACSDAFHAMLGARVQRLCGVPCVADLYDNFESYAGSRVPGVRGAFRRALGRVAGITCISGALERYVRATCRVRGATALLENGVSGEFRPQDRRACRDRFGLPLEAKVIGTAGALHAGRGVDILFQAFLRLAGVRPELYLLLAGRVDPATPLPVHERIRYLGQLPLADVPQVIGAMDVSVVCNRHSAFGEYCFPQKLYEIVACGVPPLVAATAGVAELLEGAPRNRYEPESVDSLAQGIERLLAQPSLPGFRAVEWREHAVALAAFLEKTITEYDPPNE